MNTMRRSPSFISDAFATNCSAMLEQTSMIRKIGPHTSGDGEQNSNAICPLARASAISASRSRTHGKRVAEGSEKRTRALIKINASLPLFFAAWGRRYVVAPDEGSGAPTGAGAERRT